MQVTSQRVELGHGRVTTVHIARRPRATTRLQVAGVAPAAPLDAWAAGARVADAISGGYRMQEGDRPLGLLRRDGRTLEHEPFRAPWHAIRACLHVNDGTAWIGPPDAGARASDVLQAGPQLVAGGSVALSGDDPEGFSSTCDEFDQDLTEGREPRAAIALSADEVLAVVADGRSDEDAGLTLRELAALLVDLGATDALNLDGGSAAALIVDGRLRNTPRDEHGGTLEHPTRTPSAIVLRRVGGDATG